MTTHGRKQPPKRRWTSQDDPRLKTPSYRAILKYWADLIEKANRTGGWVECQAPNCLLKNIPIKSGGPRTPAHLDVGHIIPRTTDQRQTWNIEDTRPEHARCNRSAGIKITQAIKARKKAQAQQQGTTTPIAMTINNNDW